MSSYRHIQYLFALLLGFSSSVLLDVYPARADDSGVRDAIDFEFNGRIDADIAKYERAVKNQPNSVLLHLHLGQLFLDQKGDVDKAMDQFQAALNHDPTCGSCQFRLETAQSLKEKSCDDLILDANQYYVSKQYKRAEALYRIAVRNDPQNATAHNCLAWTLYKEGNLEDGLKEVHEAMRLKADDPEFINTLGCLLYDSGDIEGALNSWRKAVVLSHKPSPADLYGIAVAFITQGDSQQARKYFEQAIKEDSRYADISFLSDKIGMSVKTLSMHDCLVALTSYSPSSDKNVK